MKNEPSIHLGTSAFTAAGWEGSFYPRGMKSADYLTFYAQHFDTVEVDSTFYRSPAAGMVRRWYSQTPSGFVFAAKVPQVITHEKVLVDCDEDFRHFLAAMDNLKEKLGPLLFQFGYFNKKAFPSVGAFLAGLVPFLKKAPSSYRFVVEVRNKNWLEQRLTEALRERGVALALTDHPWMPRPTELFEKLDPITADFAYIRWLGDRKGIEERTKTWDRVIVDRTGELQEWVNVCYKISGRGIPIFGYPNNHYKLLHNPP